VGVEGRVKTMRLAHHWSRLSRNYWFVPGTMVVAAMALSFLLPWVDHGGGRASTLVPDWVYGGGPDGARALLSTIAGSMITVAALTFSITIVGLTTASQQFGPRLLRSFISDRGYQLVLGTFLSAFVYCLLVLRTVRSTDTTQFVPYVSLAVAMIWAVAGVGVLVYFIHHAASAIRAESIVASTGRELRAAVERLFPERDRRDRPAATTSRSLPEGFPSGAREIASQGTGYIQVVDIGRLVRLAEKYDLVLRLEHRAGHFISEEGDLLEAWPARDLSEEQLAQLNDCFVLGAHRPLLPDAEAAVDQLVEIALRSLSPGINDPDTAVACIDQLADALGRAGERGIPPAFLPETGEIRLVTYPLTYVRLVDLSLSRIRQYGRGHMPVVLRLLEVIASLGPRVQHEASRSALLNQARMLKRSSDESIPEAEDRRLVDLRFRAAQRALGDPDLA